VATGDTRILEDHYEHLLKWMEFVIADSRDCVRGPGKSGTQHFGDWCALDGSSGLSGGTPLDLVGTAYFAHSSGLMSKIAGILGRRMDSERFADLRQRVVNAFRKRFLHADGSLVPPATQTGYVLALRFGLMPEHQRGVAADLLEADIKARGMHLSTGFLGTPHILHALSDANRMDTAYALLFQRSAPSWLYAVTRGATTIWERWDGWTPEKGFQDPGMNSFNHYAFGAVGEWLYRVVAGVAPDPSLPGYRRVVMRPRPGGGLTNAEARVVTGCGMVETRWEIADGMLTWRVVIPSNATASAIVPAGPAENVTEGGRQVDRSDGVKLVASTRVSTSLELGPGTYTFRAPAPGSVTKGSGE
jgi:alpha-L-rhamnosidase